MTLDRLRPSYVEGWVVELRRKGLAESTIRSAYTILRAVLDTAVRDGALAVDPATAIRRPRVTANEAAHLTPEQVAALLRAAEDSAPLFALLADTGLRRGEALALQWSDLDVARGFLRVRGTLSRIAGELVVTGPKTARSKRFVPLSEPAARLLRRIQSAQAEERRLAGPAWKQTGSVLSTEVGEPCDPRNAFRGAPGRRSQGRTAAGRPAHAPPPAASVLLTLALMNSGGGQRTRGTAGPTQGRLMVVKRVVNPPDKASEAVPDRSEDGL